MCIRILIPTGRINFDLYPHIIDQYSYEHQNAA